MRLKYPIFIYLFIFPFICLGQSTTKFSEGQVSKDLKYLYKSLINAHYNLYAYTSKQNFDLAYKEAQKAINKDSLTLLEITNIFQRLTAIANNGHTEIDFPGQLYAEYAYAGGTIFPLEIAFEKNKPLVRKNWSNNETIMIGSEVLSINSIPIGEILSKIFQQISAERPYFKIAKVELYSFPRLYWQVFGRQNDFDVKIRIDGLIKNYKIKAVDVIEGYEMKRNEVLNAEMALKFYGQSAYLNPGNFSGDEEKYRHFIDSTFVNIKEHKSQNLIIDLRNNRGGNNSFSDYLVSYFATQPFKWNSSFTLKTSKFLKEHTMQHYDTTNVFWQNVLKHKDGEIYDYTFDAYQPQPELKRFRGNVYVLVNRQSHSQSAAAS